MIQRTLLGFLVALAVLATPISVNISNAQTIAQTPPWVIKADGNVLGFFISDLGGDIVFGIKDGNTTVPLQLRSISGNHYIEGNEARVFYSGASCSGTVYVNAPTSNNVRARTRALGITYGVGQEAGNASSLRVFKGTGPTVAIGLVPINSTYINGSCGTNTNGDLVQTATSIFTFPFVGNPIPAGTITME